MQNEVSYYVTVEIPENTIVDGYSKMIPFCSSRVHDLIVAEDFFRSVLKVAYEMGMVDSYIRLWKADSDGEFALQGVTIGD